MVTYLMAPSNVCQGHNRHGSNIPDTYFRVMAVMPLTTIGWHLFGQMDMYEFSYLDSEIVSKFTVFLNR